jgi:hypothetical protein
MIEAEKNNINVGDWLLLKFDVEGFEISVQ